MRNWIGRFVERLLPAVTGNTNLTDLSLQTPQELNEQTLQAWLRELIDKLGALYEVSDGNERAFQQAYSALLRAIGTEETRLKLLERRLRALMRTVGVPQGASIIDLTDRIDSLSGVVYRDESGGYTLGSTVRTNRLVREDGQPVAWCTLARTLGSLVEGADPNLLITNHPEQSVLWVTSSPAPLTAGSWMVNHTWIPANYQSGELLLFEVESLEPFYANELVVQAGTPVTVLQYRYHVTGGRANLNPYPLYSSGQWGGSGVQSMTLDSRVCGTISSDTGSFIELSIPLPQLPSHAHSRSVMLQLTAYAEQELSLQVSGIWMRDGTAVGYTSLYLPFTDRLVWRELQVELDEPYARGGCDTLELQLRVVGEPDRTRRLLVYRLDAWVSLYHRNVDSGPAEQHLIPLTGMPKLPITRFALVVNNQLHTADTSGVRYRTVLRRIALSRTAAPRQGSIRFLPVDSKDTIRHATVTVSGSGLGKSELVLQVANGKPIRIPLGESGGSFSVSVAEEREQVADGGGYLCRVPARSMEERFDGTTGTRVELGRMPWIWRELVTEQYRKLGYYDPNASSIDAELVRRLLRNGKPEDLPWLVTLDSEWSCSGAIIRQGNWLEIAFGNSATISWDPAGTSIPDGSLLVLLLRVDGVNMDSLRVKVNGEDVRHELVQLPAGAPYPGMASYALLVDTDHVSSLQLQLGASGGAKVAICRKVGSVPSQRGFIPLQVFVRWRGLNMVPATHGERSELSGPTAVSAERLAQASESRLAEYQLWLQENQLSYQFSGERKVYMTRLYPISRNSGKPVLKVEEVLADGTRKPISESEYRLVPEFGLLELNRQLGQDSYLVASYISDAADTSVRSYAPSTVNRTDFITGAAPRLKPPELNPARSDYYPVLEYYQHGRNIVFSTPVSPLGDTPSEIRVRYLYLPSSIRTTLVLRRSDDDSQPVVERVWMSITTDAESMLSTGGS